MNNKRIPNLSLRQWLPIALICLLPTSVFAQASENQANKEQVLETSFVLHFRWDDTKFYPDYMTNPEQLAALEDFLNNQVKPEDIQSIQIFSYSSPEGVYEHNIWLSQGRSASIRTEMMNRFPRLCGKFSFDPRGESWDELRELVANDTKLSEEAIRKTLAVIDADVNVGTKKWRMEQLPWYKYLLSTYYRQIRNTGVLVIQYVKPEPVPEPEPEPEPVIVAAPAPEPEPEPEPVIMPLEKRKMILAFRSNLLVPGLNVGVEVPIGQHWSIGVDYYYPWAVAKNDSWCGEMLGLFADVKYWLPGKKYEWDDENRLMGHAIGVYGGVGYYDYQSRKQGDQGEYLDVGVDYTFGLPLGKGKYRPRFEFNVGVGYIRTAYRHYTPTADFVYRIKDPGVKQYYYNWFGPTRVGVSLVLPIYAKRTYYPTTAENK